MTDQRGGVQRRTREALDRLDEKIDQHQGYGEATDRSVATITNGMQCSISEGRWHLQADLSEGIGGTASAPTPGVLGRAALGSCLAMGYQLSAARLGVELISIRVEIEADSNVVGMLSNDASVRPGYSEVRYHVAIESAAPAADVHNVIDSADSLSPYRDVFSAPTPLVRTISINRPA